MRPMEPSAAPAFIAITAAVAGVLLAPRVLDAPPPVVREEVVRESPPPAPANGPVIAASHGWSWKLDVTDDGTATLVHRDWARTRDVVMKGPVDPALVPRLRALRERAGLVTLTGQHSCLRGPGHTAADDYGSSAEPAIHAEASELTSLIREELYRSRNFSDRVLVVSARRVEGRAGTPLAFEVEEVLHVAAGLTAPRPGARIRLEDDLPQRSHPARTVASGWEGKWFAQDHSIEEARRILAWLAAHPPTVRPFPSGYDPSDENAVPPPL